MKSTRLLGSPDGHNPGPGARRVSTAIKDFLSSQRTKTARDIENAELMVRQAQDLGRKVLDLTPQGMAAGQFRRTSGVLRDIRRRS